MSFRTLSLPPSNRVITTLLKKGLTEKTQINRKRINGVITTLLKKGLTENPE
ncbi:MAG TPA: hypothetical protein VN414_02480 [Methanosarcina sp.]|nr:hypothetical protein [Methanosarcina sp.]